MTSYPKVSVIIPVYKTEPYLHACLDSVLNQTFGDFEIICVNDGSPDKCASILDEYASKDKRITVLTQHNQGISVARNQAMKLATGEYVLFLDSDDLIHHQLLELTTTLGDKYNADMVSFDFIKKQTPDVLDYTLRPIDEIPVCVTQNALEHVKKKVDFKLSWNTWSKLYRRELIRDIPFIEGICYEDYPHTFMILKKNPTVVITREKLYYYRPNNLTSVSRSNFSSKRIEHYHIGLAAVMDTYINDKKRLYFIARYAVPRLLKAQYLLIKKEPIENQQLLWQTFASELAEVNKNGCLLWVAQPFRYFAYQKILKKYAPVN